MRSGARRGRRAFTLVELLVAMFIIAILITLVVQVARYVYEEASRKETQSIQNLTMRAVEAFHELTGEYPPDDPNDFPAGTVTTETILLYHLKGDHLRTSPQEELDLKARIKKATGPVLLELPSDVIKAGGNTIRDGFGNPMQYYRTEGLGNRPVLISAGPDGQFGNEDDIRSDEH